jgi:hypothetical protein
MQKAKLEFAQTVLTMLMDGKTEKEISCITQKHRNTISAYVKLIREQNIFDLSYMKNKVTSEIDKRIPQMGDRDLLNLYEILHGEIPKDTTEPNKLFALRWLTDEEWKNKLSSNTARIVGKENFTKAQQGSVCSHVEDDGEKPVVAQTSS